MIRKFGLAASLWVVCGSYLVNHPKLFKQYLEGVIAKVFPTITNDGSRGPEMGEYKLV